MSFNALGYFWLLLYATATHIAELSDCDLMTFETRARGYCATTSSQTAHFGVLIIAVAPQLTDRLSG